MVFPVVMYGCEDCEESWGLKNWCFWTVVLEKTLASPLDCKEIQPVHSKGDQPWVFFGRNDAKAETPVLWPPRAKSWLIGKDSDAGTDWRQEEKGTTEDEMAGWHHWLDGRESEWTLGVGDGQGGLACCYSWGHKGQTRLSNWTELNWIWIQAVSWACFPGRPGGGLFPPLLWLWLQQLNLCLCHHMTFILVFSRSLLSTSSSSFSPKDTSHQL